MYKKSIRTRSFFRATKINFKQFLEKYFKSIHALNNFEIDEFAKKCKIKNWRGVFMRDELKGKPLKHEVFIMNTDVSKNNGTHWVGIFIGEEKYYFDSFGFSPPLEVIKYIGKPIKYNTFQLQGYDDVICGHFSLYVLWRLSNGDDFENILFDII